MKRELFWAGIRAIEGQLDEMFYSITPEEIKQFRPYIRNCRLAIRVLRYAGKGDCGAILAACDKTQREAEKGEK